MGLFTLHICCALCSLDYLKSKLESKSRLPFSQFSDYYCKTPENLAIFYTEIPGIFCALSYINNQTDPFFFAVKKGLSSSF